MSNVLFVPAIIILVIALTVGSPWVAIVAFVAIVIMALAQALRATSANTAGPQANGARVNASKSLPRWFWGLMILSMVLVILNANVRNTFMHYAKPAAQEWTTAAKIFDVTITSSNTFEIGRIEAGQWKYSIDATRFWCKKPEWKGMMDGILSGSSQYQPSDVSDYPVKTIRHGVLLISTKKGLGGAWVEPGGTLISVDDDEIIGIVNVPPNCTFTPIVKAKLALTPP